MWVESLLPSVVDLATFGLAVLGGSVALKPPGQDQRVLKFLYFACFILLALVGFGAGQWGRNIENITRSKLQEKQTRTEERFSEDLKAVKRSSDAILAFVANPPKGITQEQLSAFAKAYLESQKGNGQGSPATPMQASPLPSQPPNHSQPVILSAPRILTDGQIAGKNFGTVPRELHLHIRVKAAAQHGDYGSDGKVGPDALLGGLDGSNYPILSGNIVQQWSDTSIRLRFPDGYWQGLLGAIASEAKDRQLSPPQQSDLEVCYQIRIPDEGRSELFCQQ
jgi:hypothetical protein